MKRVIQQIGVYKKDALWCVALTTLEVIMEILLPFITARLIAEGLEASNLSAVYRYGAVLVVMALLSLTFGATAGKFAASASSGFAANLREAIYNNIQTFSFSNIDKFSVPGLVTRMTTDITNVQQAFMMMIRIAVRSPLTLVFSFAMCFYINRDLSLTFLIALAFLLVVIGTIMAATLRIFSQVFRKYDDLNASVQENVSAIRVVKAVTPDLSTPTQPLTVRSASPSAPPTTGTKLETANLTAREAAVSAEAATMLCTVRTPV